MTENRHNEDTSLSRLSSEEKPAAHVDKTVSELARKSMRPGAFSTFASHWITGGAVAAVAVISVLLVQTVSQQADLYAPDQDAMAPSGDVFNGVKKQAARRDALPSDPLLTAEQLQQARSALKTRFLDREELKALKEDVQAQESRTSMQQAAALAVEDSASSADIPDKITTVSEQTILPPLKQSPILAGESPAGIEKMPGLVAQPPIKQVPALAMEKSASTGVMPKQEVLVSEQETRSPMKQALAPTVEDSTSAAAIAEKEMAVSAQDAQSAVKQVQALTLEDSTSTAAMPDKKAMVSEQQPRSPLKAAAALASEAAAGATTAAPALTKDEHAGTAGSAQVLAADVTASATVSATGVKYYLQAGSFRRMTRANKLKTELAELGFSSDIKAARIEGKGIYYRVLAGPFTDRAARAISKRKLAELGIETRAKTDRK